MYIICLVGVARKYFSFDLPYGPYNCDLEELRRRGDPRVSFHLTWCSLMHSSKHHVDITKKHHAFEHVL